jgi:hypothetical protein
VLLEAVSGDLMIAKKTIVIGAIIIFLLASAVVGFVSERQSISLQGGLMVKELAPTVLNDRAMNPSAPTANVESYAGQTQSIEKKTIFTASISLEVKEFKAAVDKVSLIASRYGGYISDSFMNNEGVGRKTGYVIVRVSEKDFDAAIADLEKVGDVLNKNISGQDVTEEYIDLEARMANLKLEEQRYRDILKKAEKVEDLLAIERELSRVRGEIESMQGRLNYLKNRVDLATITVNLAEPEVVVHESKFKQAIDAAIEGFLATIRGMVILAGYLFPLFLILLLIWGIWRVIKIVKK